MNNVTNLISISVGDSKSKYTKLISSVSRITQATAKYIDFPLLNSPLHITSHNEYDHEVLVHLVRRYLFTINLLLAPKVL